MVSVSALLFPVSFVLESGAPCFVVLSRDDGTALSAEVTGDAEQTARRLLGDTLSVLTGTGLAEAPEAARQELRDLSSRFLAVAGARSSGAEVQLIYTSMVPVPLAEEHLDITHGSPFSWRTISRSRGRLSTHSAPEQRTGADAIVLDYWRQAFEESDIALDFLPEHLSLLQLRSTYDAIWGYSQDPSGFKRWAIDRTGALRDLLEEVPDPGVVDESVFTSLGRRLSPDRAAKAGAILASGLSSPLPPALKLTIGLTAASTANKLHHRRGPEPTWFRKSDAWRPGPTWIQHLYPPRPNWTLWDVER